MPVASEPFAAVYEERNRLDEIERKLDLVLRELQTPTAIGYSVRRGNLPRKD